MRVSPLIFLGAPLVGFGEGVSANEGGSCGGLEGGSLPSSRAMKASEMRRSVLSDAWVGLLWRHRSEQYFTGVDAALVVCDFRIPLQGTVSVGYIKPVSMLTILTKKGPKAGRFAK